MNLFLFFMLMHFVSELLVVGPVPAGRPAADGTAGEGGGADGADQHRQAGHTLDNQGRCSHSAVDGRKGSAIGIVAIANISDSHPNTRHDEEDRSEHRGDDGHDHGGDHEALVATARPGDGQTSADYEEDRGPDSGGERDVAIDYPHNVSDHGDHAADDVDAAQDDGGPGIVGLLHTLSLLPLLHLASG